MNGCLLFSADLNVIVLGGLLDGSRFPQCYDTMSHMWNAKAKTVDNANQMTNLKIVIYCFYLVAYLLLLFTTELTCIFGHWQWNRVILCVLLTISWSKASYGISSNGEHLYKCLVICWF